MEINDLRILVVGCGSIGKRHADCLHSIGIKHLIFFDVNETLAREQAEAYGGIWVKNFPEGVAAADVVYILSPTKLHMEQATYAVQHGRHVFVEKPLAADLCGTTELEAQAKEKGVQVGVAFCMRFHEGVQKMKWLLDSGAIGKLVSIRAMMGEHFPTVRPDYLSTYYVQYSGAFELVHDLDLAIFFGNQPVLHYSGFYGAYADMGFASPDTVELLVQFENCLASVHLDFFQNPRTRTMTLMGTRGQLQLEFGDWNKYTLRQYRTETGCWEEETCQTTRNAMFVAESEHFLKAVTGRGENQVPISEAVKSLTIVRGVYKE